MSAVFEWLDERWGKLLPSDPNTTDMQSRRFYQDVCDGCRAGSSDLPIRCWMPTTDGGRLVRIAGLGKMRFRTAWNRFKTVANCFSPRNGSV